jgi:hypothetical protein
MFDFLMGYVLGERAASRAAAFSRSAGAAAGSAAAGDMYDLELRMDRLLLVVDAMWSLMRENGLTDEDLAARIRQLDESDGTVDGRRTPQPVRCQNCDSMVEPGRPTCAFCGAAVGAGGPLDRI